MKTKRIQYIRNNWKLGAHLLFRTKRFGVNNRWWSYFDSIFGISNLEKIKAVILIRPLIEIWKHMRFRAGACHILGDESYELLYGETKLEYQTRIS